MSREFTLSSTDRIDMGDPVGLQDLWAGGAQVGSLSGWWYPRSDGTNDSGRVLDKLNWVWWTGLQASSRVTVNFQVLRSTTNGRWRLNSVASDGPEINKWSHVVVTYDASSTANDPKIYVNGGSKAIDEVTAPSGTVTADAGNNLILGNRVAGPNNRVFDGFLADIRIFDRILTQAEVDELYAGRQHSVVDALAWWPLEGSTSALAERDISGNGHSGTETGTVHGTQPRIFRG